MLKSILIGLTLLIASSFNTARAQFATFYFTGTIISTFGVPNAGTTVSGYITFDPTVPLGFSCGAPHCGGYFQSAPATFYFTTDAGFTLQQTLTEINISDKFANGITDYYVFDADVGTSSPTTKFSRLELTLSNNQNAFIPNISIPTAVPEFSKFQFHTVAFFGFTGNTPSQRVEASLTSLTVGLPPTSIPVMLPPSLAGFALLLTGFGGWVLSKRVGTL